MGTTVKTRVLIISDTHGAPLSKPDGNGRGRPIYPPFKAPLPHADLLIHGGDMTFGGHLDEYGATLDMLKEIDAPVKLVIAGNHDLSLDRDFMIGHVGRRQAGWKKIENREAAESIVEQAKALWTAPNGRATMEGVTLLEEGLHQIDLHNGARISIYASPYTPEFHDFAFPYKRHEDRFNPSSASLVDGKNIARHPVPSFSPEDSIDFMIVHGPPYLRLDETARGENVGCPHLLKALMRARPLVCCFGHIHEGWGAERIQWSDSVDECGRSSTSITEWKQSGWLAGIASDGAAIERINVDQDVVKKERGAYLDISITGGQPIRRGEETVLVNAAIMDIKYNPVNAPWLLDIDLPLVA